VQGHRTESGATWYPSRAAIENGTADFVVQTHQAYRKLLLQAGKVTDEQLERVAIIKPRKRAGRPEGSAGQAGRIDALQALLDTNPELKPTTAARALSNGDTNRANYLVKCWRLTQRKKSL
jgi:hypothetical protein